MISLRATMAVASRQLPLKRWHCMYGVVPPLRHKHISRALVDEVGFNRKSRLSILPEEKKRKHGEAEVTKVVEF